MRSEAERIARLQETVARLRAENAKLRREAEEDANTFNQHHEDMLNEIEKYKQQIAELEAAYK